MISEQQLLVSYRDCRKQNGDLFSWSKVSDQILIDTNKLKSSSFCSGKIHFFEFMNHEESMMIRLCGTSINSWWKISCIRL
jgi:hypothetical protein